MTAGDFKVPALQQNGSSCLRLEQLLSNKTNRKTAVERRASVLITHSTQVFFRCLLCNCCWLAVCIVAVVLCVLLSYVNLLYCVGNAFFFFTLDTGLLVISQDSEDPATDHIDTGFSWFPCAEKQMLRWFPIFQVATTCLSCSPPDLNLVVTNFMFCLHVK